jgi:phosphoglycerate dehydrogenase-like enzyme
VAHVRVINLIGAELTALLGERFGDQVEVVELVPDGPVDDALSGDVLLAPGRAAGRPAAAWLADVARRGVKWLHVAGANVGDLPDDVFADGRVVTCSRGAMATPISEFVLASMLAFEKRFPFSWISEPVDGWAFQGRLDPSGSPEEALMRPPSHWGLAPLGSLDGKVLGIFGFGSIGRATAAKALPFGMRVLAVRRSAAPSGMDGVEIVRDLGELAEAADHLVLCAPGTPSTERIVNDAVFARTKPTAHLVNVGRGTLVDQDALLRALDDGRLAFASIDVPDPEPLPAGHRLYTHPKVHLTPHISWCSPHQQARTAEIVVENVRRWLAGEELHGRVDPSQRY